MILLSCVCVIISCAVFYVLKEWKWILMHMKIHREPWNWPGVGNATVWTQGGEARMEMLNRFGKISINHGGLANLWLGTKHFLVVSDANIAEILLKTCLTKDDTMNITHELFGNGSIFAPVQIWRPRRKVIAPTFSIKNLNQFVEVFYKQSCIMVEQLREKAGKGTFSIWNYLTAYSMDSVCESALGVKVGAQRHSGHPVIDSFNLLCEISAARLVLPPFAQKAFRWFPIFKTTLIYIHTMWDFVDDIVNSKRKELAEKKTCNNYETKESKLDVQKTFLELFIESSGGGSGFTNLELREESLVLLLAGTDTSAVGSAFTCLMLARHQDVQEKVYQEIKEVLGDSKGAITPKDLPNLKYLEAVIKESLRLYPPVPVIVRKVDKDCQLPSGQTIVKGTSLLFSIWAVQRNPQYWGIDSEEFKPDRFIGSSLSHPAAFMPFSHGPRSCLGYQYAMMSMKTAVASLVRQYRVQPASPAADKPPPLRIKFDVMMKHVHNFELQLDTRE